MKTWTFSERGAALGDSAIRALTKRLAGATGIVSFAGGMPSPETFPTAAFSRAFETILTREGKQALQYGPTDGYLPLREWIAARLSTNGATFRPEQVLITSGSQQGLDLVGKVFLDPGDRVAVETPTYLGALQCLGLYQPEFVEVDCDDEGIVVDHLTEVAKRGRLRLLYTIPTFQNPTGRVLSPARRAALARAADAAGVPLIEDDPYGELDYRGEVHRPLVTLNPENTVYLGSFSKILSPGIRLGYLVAPMPALRKLEMAKQASDLHSPTITQRVVYEIIRDESFLARHLEACRRLYASNAGALDAALSTHLAGKATWRAPRGGMFQWLELLPHVDATQLLERALTAGVAYVPGAPFYAVAPKRNVARLCFSTLDRDTIERGISRLAQVLQDSTS